MARQIVDIDGLEKILPLTKNQIYKATKRTDYPLPFKKCGKRLLVDVEKIFRWFDQFDDYLDELHYKAGISYLRKQRKELLELPPVVSDLRLKM
jgi:hypothetical protein